MTHGFDVHTPGSKVLKTGGRDNFIGSREYLPDGLRGPVVGRSQHSARPSWKQHPPSNDPFLYNLGQILSLKLWMNPHPLTSSSRLYPWLERRSCSASPLSRLMSSPFLDWLSVFIPVDLFGAPVNLRCPSFARRQIPEDLAIIDGRVLIF